MSKLVPARLTRIRVQIGSDRIVAGKSHSCERPTNDFWSPRAHTISVAEGRSVTTFMESAIKSHCYAFESECVVLIAHFNRQSLSVSHVSIASRVMLIVDGTETLT